jgi:phosphoribosyl-AMP cyclohydrolase / phosphoribosyl-ATP pyrophosphohydrolase
VTRIDDLQWDSGGLIPAVVQDAKTGEVLTLAYMNRDSLIRTRELGETVFYSRSRNALWHKGETSGHYQKVMALMADCDRDAVVVQVRPLGPACHTGARTCFFEQVDGFAPAKREGIGFILEELEGVIRERKTTRPTGSYTTSLFEGGLKRILQKVGEEATETIVAALSGDRQETIKESADLIYHLMVGLHEMGISLEEIAAELQSRRR